VERVVGVAVKRNEAVALERGERRWQLREGKLKEGVVVAWRQRGGGGGGDGERRETRGCERGGRREEEEGA
jgi:hypothetical protein